MLKVPKSTFTSEPVQSVILEEGQPASTHAILGSAPCDHVLPFESADPGRRRGARKGVPSLRGQTHVTGMRVARSGLRGQDERDKWKQTGSFWTRLRLGKAVAGSGVRSQTLHKK